MYKSAKSAAQKPRTRADTVEFKVMQILVTLSSAAYEASDRRGNSRVIPVTPHGTINMRTADWNDSTPSTSPSVKIGYKVPISAM